MVRQWFGKRWYVGTLVVAFCVCGGAPAEAQFTSGSSGIHGAFPPPPSTGNIHETAAFIVWNMATGTVRYCSSYTIGSGSDQCLSGTTTLVQIPGTEAGGPATGIYEFTQVDVVGTSTFRRIAVVGASSNVPLTILSAGDIKLGTNVQLYVNGETATANHASHFAQAGARGGPGGFDGGMSGNGGVTPAHGSAGFGPAGGAGGRTDAITIAAHNGAPAGPAPLNISLTPLTGGSGGGAASGQDPTPSLGCTGVGALGAAGGAGGGGGGALLLAASNRIELGSNSTIFAHGGTGGSHNSFTTCLRGGGGGGGSVRLVARELAGNGAINVIGGTDISGSTANRAPGGHVRLEASLNGYTGTISGASGGSFLSFPTAAVPSNQPVLRITSIGGVSAPAVPTASLAVPDISFAAPVDAPVAVTVEASNVPSGTTVQLRVVPVVGEPSTTTTGGLADSGGTLTATAQVTLPPGPGVVTASASFSIAGGGGGGGGGAAALNMRTLIDGKPFERVEVTAQADGSSRAYLIAQNGVRFELATATR